MAWLGPELEVEMILRTVEGADHSLIKHGSHSPLPLLPFHEPPREKGAGRSTLCFIPLKRLRGASGAPVLCKCQYWAGRTTSPSGHDPLAKSLCSDSPRQAQLIPRVAEVRFWTLCTLLAPKSSFLGGHIFSLKPKTERAWDSPSPSSLPSPSPAQKPRQGSLKSTTWRSNLGRGRRAEAGWKGSTRGGN